MGAQEGGAHAWWEGGGVWAGGRGQPLRGMRWHGAPSLSLLSPAGCTAEHASKHTHAQCCGSGRYRLRQAAPLQRHAHGAANEAGGEAEAARGVLKLKGGVW